MIAVMLTGGVLEARAAARARRELSALAARAPRMARRQTPAGSVEVPVGQVAVGDRLLVGAGRSFRWTGGCWTGGGGRVGADG